MTSATAARPTSSPAAPAATRAVLPGTPAIPAHVGLPELAVPALAPSAAAAARRGQLPPARPIAWRMKPLESAQTTQQVLPDGRQRLTIKHDVLKGVTPAMVHWWFTHIRGYMTVDGEVYERYLAWHPRDHIHWSHTPAPDGTAGAGARFHIVEALGRNPEHVIAVQDEVVWSDETGFHIVGRRLGVQISQMTHRFTAVPGTPGVPGGTQYDSELIVGTTLPIIGPLVNAVLRARVFTQEMGRAWLTHNVEEVGNFERFLPQLYASQAGAGGPQ